MTDVIVQLTQMAAKLGQLTSDYAELKADQRRIFDRLDAIGMAQVGFTSLLDTINAAARRSDDRWNEMTRDRREDLADWREWRTEVNNRLSRYDGAVKAGVVLWSLLTAGVGSLVWGRLHK